MFRSVFARGIPSIQPVRFNSTLAQLSQTIKSANGVKASTNKSVVSDIDDLLMGSKLGSSTSNNNNNAENSSPASAFQFKSTDYLLQHTLRHPREVAKSIRIFGPQAGRTFDVNFGNIGATMGSIKTILRTNKIRQLNRVQARHIRSAKYQKQKHREWWRRNFSAGFKDLMAQVRDAKRRGY